MKNFVIYAIAIALFGSCSQTENYKDVRMQVLEHHDSIMIDSELAFRNKMRLDTLSTRLDSLKKARPDLDTLKERTQINDLRAKLNRADEAMNHWMHQFDAEAGQKSNDEAVAYFRAEKMKIDSLAKLFKDLLKQSDEYLQRVAK